eukprot:TRINITY_DN790_c0_g1_i1.p1 TRINITY_DN790_c0_g1~~TRINITY_DN790_c0_g1_i1.p1  ORF type:complete len:2572 (-),score=692.53 TRINITY_DN790_c0_g1_i1:225-7940(-)
MNVYLCLLCLIAFFSKVFSENIDISILFSGNIHGYGLGTHDNIVSTDLDLDSDLSHYYAFINKYQENLLNNNPNVNSFSFNIGNNIYGSAFSDLSDPIGKYMFEVLNQFGFDSLCLGKEDIMSESAMKCLFGETCSWSTEDRMRNVLTNVGNYGSNYRSLSLKNDKKALVFGFIDNITQSYVDIVDPIDSLMEEISIRNIEEHDVIILMLQMDLQGSWAKRIIDFFSKKYQVKPVIILTNEEVDNMIDHKGNVLYVSSSNNFESFQILNVSIVTHTLGGYILSTLSTESIPTSNVKLSSFLNEDIENLVQNDENAKKIRTYLKDAIIDLDLEKVIGCINNYLSVSDIASAIIDLFPVILEKISLDKDVEGVFLMNSSRILKPLETKMITINDIYGVLPPLSSLYVLQNINYQDNINAFNELIENGFIHSDFINTKPKIISIVCLNDDLETFEAKFIGYTKVLTDIDFFQSFIDQISTTRYCIDYFSTTYIGDDVTDFQGKIEETGYNLKLKKNQVMKIITSDFVDVNGIILKKGLFVNNETEDLTVKILRQYCGLLINIQINIFDVVINPTSISDKYGLFIVKQTIEGIKYSVTGFTVQYAYENVIIDGITSLLVPPEQSLYILVSNSKQGAVSLKQSVATVPELSEDNPLTLYESGFIYLTTLYPSNVVKQRLLSNVKVVLHFNQSTNEIKTILPNSFSGYQCDYDCYIPDFEVTKQMVWVSVNSVTELKLQQNSLQSFEKNVNFEFSGRTSGYLDNAIFDVVLFSSCSTSTRFGAIIEGSFQYLYQDTDQFGHDFHFEDMLDIVFVIEPTSNVKQSCNGYFTSNQQEVTVELFKPLDISTNSIVTALFDGIVAFKCISSETCSLLIVLNNQMVELDGSQLDLLPVIKNQPIIYVEQGTFHFNPLPVYDMYWGDEIHGPCVIQSKQYLQFTIGSSSQLYIFDHNFDLIGDGIVDGVILNTNEYMVIESTSVTSIVLNPVIPIDKSSYYLSRSETILFIASQSLLELSSDYKFSIGENTKVSGTVIQFFVPDFAKIRLEAQRLISVQTDLKRVDSADIIVYEDDIAIPVVGQKVVKREFGVGFYLLKLYANSRCNMTGSYLTSELQMIVYEFDNEVEKMIEFEENVDFYLTLQCINANFHMDIKKLEFIDIVNDKIDVVISKDTFLVYKSVNSVYNSLIADIRTNSTIEIYSQELPCIVKEDCALDNHYIANPQTDNGVEVILLSSHYDSMIIITIFIVDTKSPTSISLNITKLYENHIRPSDKYYVTPLFDYSVMNLEGYSFIETFQSFALKVKTFGNGVYLETLTGSAYDVKVEITESEFIFHFFSYTPHFIILLSRLNTEIETAVQFEVYSVSKSVIDFPNYNLLTFPAVDSAVLHCIELRFSNDFEENLDQSLYFSSIDTDVELTAITAEQHKVVVNIIDSLIPSCSYSSNSMFLIANTSKKIELSISLVYARILSNGLKLQPGFNFFIVPLTSLAISMHLELSFVFQENSQIECMIGGKGMILSNDKTYCSDCTPSLHAISSNDIIDIDGSVGDTSKNAYITLKTEKTSKILFQNYRLKNVATALESESSVVLTNSALSVFTLPQTSENLCIFINSNSSGIKKVATFENDNNANVNNIIYDIINKPTRRLIDIGHANLIMIETNDYAGAQTLFLFRDSHYVSTTHSLDVHLTHQEQFVVLLTNLVFDENESNLGLFRMYNIPSNYNRDPNNIYIMENDVIVTTTDPLTDPLIEIDFKYRETALFGSIDTECDLHVDLIYQRSVIIPEGTTFVDIPQHFGYFAEIDGHHDAIFVNLTVYPELHPFIAEIFTFENGIISRTNQVLEIVQFSIIPCSVLDNPDQSILLSIWPPSSWDYSTSGNPRVQIQIINGGLQLSSDENEAKFHESVFGPTLLVFTTSSHYISPVLFVTMGCGDLTLFDNSVQQLTSGWCGASTKGQYFNRVMTAGVRQRIDVPSLSNKIYLLVEPFDMAPRFLTVNFLSNQLAKFVSEVPFSSHNDIFDEESNYLLLCDNENINTNTNQADKLAVEFVISYLNASIKLSFYNGTKQNRLSGPFVITPEMKDESMYFFDVDELLIVVSPYETATCVDMTFHANTLPATIVTYLRDETLVLTNGPQLIITDFYEVSEAITLLTVNSPVKEEYVAKYPYSPEYLNVNITEGKNVFPPCISTDIIMIYTSIKSTDGVNVYSTFRNIMKFDENFQTTTIESKKNFTVYLPSISSMKYELRTFSVGVFGSVELMYSFNSYPHPLCVSTINQETLLRNERINFHDNDESVWIECSGNIDSVITVSNITLKSSTDLHLNYNEKQSYEIMVEYEQLYIDILTYPIFIQYFMTRSCSNGIFKSYLTDYNDVQFGNCHTISNIFDSKQCTFCYAEQSYLAAAFLKIEGIDVIEAIATGLSVKEISLETNFNYFPGTYASPIIIGYNVTKVTSSAIFKLQFDGDALISVSNSIEELEFPSYNAENSYLFSHQFNSSKGLFFYVCILPTSSNDNGIVVSPNLVQIPGAFYLPLVIFGFILGFLGSVFLITVCRNKSNDNDDFEVYGLQLLSNEEQAKNPVFFDIDAFD